jgi:hypothetical protein|eukprot:1092339_1
MKTFLFTVFALLFLSAQAFVAPKTNTLSNSLQNSQPVNTLATSSTSLNGRKWNFNEGRGPFGLKANAEIWNGRVAQMGFTVVLLQELITGKGVIQGLQEGNVFNLAMVGLTAVSVLGLSAFLAIKGKDSDVIIEK